jgi:hypothetical protein
MLRISVIEAFILDREFIMIAGIKIVDLPTDVKITERGCFTSQAAV